MLLFGMKSRIIAGVAAAVICISSANAKDYKMSTISLPTPFALNTTFAKIVQKYNKDIKIQIMDQIPISKSNRIKITSCYIVYVAHH